MADEVPSTGEETAPEAAPAKAKVPWVPLVLVLLFIPIITLVLVEFVVVPKLKSTMAAEFGAEGAAATGHAAPAVEKEADGGHGGGGHGGGDAAPAGDGMQVAFEGIITNIAGTMGTRFLKVSFQAVGTSAELGALVRSRDAQVQDSIITTLSGMSMRELEAPGGRNAMRIALISAINSAIGLNLVKELYFTEFIVQ